MDCFAGDLWCVCCWRGGVPTPSGGCSSSIKPRVRDETGPALPLTGRGTRAVQGLAAGVGRMPPSPTALRPRCHGGIYGAAEIERGRGRGRGQCVEERQLLREYVGQCGDDGLGNGVGLSSAFLCVAAGQRDTREGLWSGGFRDRFPPLPRPPKNSQWDCRAGRGEYSGPSRGFGRPPPPPHIRQTFLTGQTEFIRRGRKWRPICTDANFVSASDPPPLRVTDACAWPCTARHKRVCKVKVKEKRSSVTCHGRLSL